MQESEKVLKTLYLLFCLLFLGVFNYNWKKVKINVATITGSSRTRRFKSCLPGTTGKNILKETIHALN